MIGRLCCLTAACLLVAVTARAQGPGPQDPVGLALALQRSYANLKTNLTQAAAKMPDADYASKPSTMAEVRTYGQLFGHVANAQYNSCSAVKGVPNPNMGTNLEQKTTKAEFVKALADSFAFCDDAFASLTDANAAEFRPQGRGQTARAAILANMLSHSNEMYGTAGVYLRAKNIVPPSTENAAAARAGGPGRGN